MMHFRAPLLLAAALALASLAAASPSYHAGGADAASDNAYPQRPAAPYTPTDDTYDDTYDDAKPDRPHSRRPRGADAGRDAKEPCTSTAYVPPPTTTTPCSTSTTESYRPTDTPSGVEQGGDTRPDHQDRPVCPAPVTITREHTQTLPAQTVTATRTSTVHDVRTATQTKYATVTATSTIVKPVVEYKTVTKPVEVTKTCTVTSTVEEYVTKVKTIHDVQTKTVTQDVYKTVTKTAAALPTEEAKAPCHTCGQDKPASDSAYGPVQPYDAGAMPTHDEATYLPTASPESAYGY